MRLKSNYQKRMKKDQLNSNNQEPSPWQLVDHIEEF